MKDVAVFLGTRPEAIKLAPVIRAMAASPSVRPVVVSTGQHREMLRQVVELFRVPVDHDLDVMQPGQTLASLTARLMTAIDGVLERVKPAMAVVQGDTTTTMVGALACFYRRIPTAHVEAGLRTGNIWSPFPEEVNRRLATQIVSLHFPPTEESRRNLLAEGVPEDRVFVTGNTVIDALHIEMRRQEEPGVRERVRGSLAGQLGEGWEGRPFVLVTGHRRENFGGGFEQICRALARLGREFPDYDLVYPVHLNPNVLGPVRETLGGIANIRLIAPQQYSEFVMLMRSCRMVLTDSGGVQEEAPAFGKPVLVMRETTERPEGVQAGTVKLVGADADRIVENVALLLRDQRAYGAMSGARNPYGDGLASGRIVDRIAEYLAR